MEDLGDQKGDLSDQQEVIWDHRHREVLDDHWKVLGNQKKYLGV